MYTQCTQCGQNSLGAQCNVHVFQAIRRRYVVTVKRKTRFPLTILGGIRAVMTVTLVPYSGSNSLIYICAENLYIPDGPIKTEQSIQSIFQDFALINSYLCSPCGIEHLFLIIITPRSSNLVENFLFYE